MVWSLNRELFLIALAIGLHVCYRWLYVAIIDGKPLLLNANVSWVEAPAPPPSVILPKEERPVHKVEKLAQTETPHIDLRGEGTQDDPQRKGSKPFSERLEGYIESGKISSNPFKMKINKTESDKVTATEVPESTAPPGRFVVEIKEYDKMNCMGKPALTWYLKPSDSECGPFSQLLRSAGDHQKVRPVARRRFGHITCEDLRGKPGFVMMCPSADKCSKDSCQYVPVEKEGKCGQSFIRPSGATWRCVPAAMVVEG